MRSDQEFIDDLERAARALRAAASGMLAAGASPQDIARIVSDGIGQASHWPATISARARLDDIGYRPHGQPLPERQHALQRPVGEGRPGDPNWRPPPLHFAVPGRVA